MLTTGLGDGARGVEGLYRELRIERLQKQELPKTINFRSTKYAVFNLLFCKYVILQFFFFSSKLNNVNTCKYILLNCF